MTAPNANPALADARWLRRRYVKDFAPVMEIAAEAGCHPSKVWVALRRHGIPLRGRSDGVTPKRLTRRAVLAAYKAADGPVESSGPLGNRASAARRLGVSVATLGAAEWRLGLRSDDRVGEAGRLYASGLTYAQVAERMGLSPRYAARLVHGSGVTIRPRGRRAQVQP